MEGSDKVFTILKERKFTSLSSLSFLVPNRKGLELALNAGISNIAIFGAVTETFSKKNLNCSIEDSISTFKDVIHEAKRINPKIIIRGSTIHH